MSCSGTRGAEPWTAEDGATAGAVACAVLEGGATGLLLDAAPQGLGWGILVLPLLPLLFSGPGAYALGVPLARLLRRKDRLAAVLIALCIGPALGLLNRAVLVGALCGLADVGFEDLRSAALFLLPGTAGGLGIGLGACLARHDGARPSSYS